VLLPGTGATPVKIEVTERQPFGSQLRLLSGHFPVATPVPSPGKPGATLEVVMTRQTAATLGLHAGSTFVLPGRELASTGLVTAVTVQVTGIVVPVNPASSFWGIDPGVLAADLQGSDLPGSTQPPYWAGAVMVGPGEAGELQSYFGSPDLRLEWVFPLDVSSLDGQQVQPLSDALNQDGTQAPALAGDLEPVASTFTISSSMLFSLNTFIATAQSVDTLLWLLYVSLTVAAVAVLLLAARMVALRRSPEITLLRARGASLRQIAIGTAGEAARLCVPAAVIAAGLAILAVPGAGSAPGTGSAGGWWPPVAVVATAVLGPALIAAWQHRLPRRQTALSPRQQAQTRLVIELTLVAAAVAGIVVFRDQAGSGLDLYTSSAPVLVAIPAVIVVLRLYPLVLRGLLRAYARTSGAPAFLGLARASRNAVTPALPAFVLVLALTVAAFAGMVRDAVINGEVAASWQLTGADATGRARVRGSGVHHRARRRPGDRRRSWRDARGRGRERVLDHPGRPPGRRHCRGPRQLRRASRSHRGVRAGAGRTAGGTRPGGGTSARPGVTASRRRPRPRPGHAQDQPLVCPGGPGPGGRRGIEHPRAAGRRGVRDHAAGRDHADGAGPGQ
jgi:putative ABC transport system permease protein